jgi:hypothetical protein
MKRSLWVCLLTALLLTMAVPAAAQSGVTGAIIGVVKDPTGAAVSDARVVAVERATGARRETVTDREGNYRLAALPVGEYQLLYEASGFKLLERSGVTVEAAVTRAIEIELAIGDMNERIAVTEDAPLLQTTQSTTFRQFNTTELLEVPSSTRNFTHLLSAEAGINSDLPPVLGNDTGSISPSVNGTRTTSNSLVFNGIDATSLLTNEGSLTENIAPAPETIQEVKLQTSLYDASTGRNGGGNFQIVTRGGSNELHGSGYFFLQNRALNANDFFFNESGISKPEASRYEGGFTLGGPLVRDKVFLFGSYQRTNARTAFVPTGSSIVDLPLFLDFASGRTAADLASAVNAARAACGLSPLSLTAAQIAPVAVNIMQLRNPATGDYILPAPGYSGCPTRTNSSGNLVPDLDPAGHPMVRAIRQVFPSEFQQDQFTLRNDYTLSDSNRMSAVFFFSNFPSLDAFPDPSSLASPFTLRRNNRARTLAVSDTHVFRPNLINDFRVGFLHLNNTRSLDDPFLTSEMTSEAVGIFNPALLFDDSPGTRRLGHFIWRGTRLSFGGPNDSFNKRKQLSVNVTDTMSWTRGRHAFRFGGELRRHNISNDLPEEQATEFEKFANFTQFLQGLATEADTQYGITAKDFRSTDLAWFFADDWKVTSRLTFNLGLRWDWFGWPVEKNGLFGNFDPNIADTENPMNGFLLPNNVRPTGLAPIDQTVAITPKAGNKHTLNGQDLNNYQPRAGFAWQPFRTSRIVLRGGYGIFYDRPSAAFINTVFSNYPFLREVEVTFPTGAVPIATAFSQIPTNLPFSAWLPMRVTFESNNYRVRDNTGVTLGADGVTPNPPCDGLPVCPGSVAETLEFRAIDRNLKTPYIQQWNLGWQFEVSRDLMWEIRYAGSKGTRLLNAVALAESWDMNDPNVPDAVFARFNQAYALAGSPRGALGAGSIPSGLPSNVCPGGQPSCLAGVGRAFGFFWGTGSAFGPLSGQFDHNLGQPATSATTSAIIPFEARAIFLGMNIPEAIILKSNGNSIYHALQTNLVKRFSRGLQFNLGYTFSRSIDDNSADPGSTAGGGKPDVPNTGFIVQGSARDLRANRGLSDFDRTHRFSASFVWDVPTAGMRNPIVTGWQISGFAQVQSGAPYSIFTSEPEARSAAALQTLNAGSGGLFRLGFGRPSLAPGVTVQQLRNSGSGLMAFDTSLLTSGLGFNGTLGRNVLRATYQKRFDFAISKTTNISERYKVEFRTEAFNLFNNTNFALPIHDLQDSDVGQILNTVGGPRVIQFGFRFVF